MSYHAPTHCPVCHHTMALTRLHCERCDTELTGRFAPCRFCSLEEKDKRFIEAFLRARGSIKEVERMLGVSYPTVKNMLETTLTALGWNETAAESVKRPCEPSQQQEILDQLAAGEINVSAALKKLKKEAE